MLYQSVNQCESIYESVWINLLINITPLTRSSRADSEYMHVSLCTWIFRGVIGSQSFQNTDTLWGLRARPFEPIQFRFGFMVHLASGDSTSSKCNFLVPLNWNGIDAIGSIAVFKTSHKTKAFELKCICISRVSHLLATLYLTHNPYVVLPFAAALCAIDRQPVSLRLSNDILPKCK